MIDDNEELDPSEDPKDKSQDGNQGVPDKSDDKEKEEKEAREEMERMKMLLRADQVKGEQLSIDGTGDLFTEDELKKLILSVAHDPDKMYEVYYKGIDKLLRQHLPKSSSYKTAREHIYEEKNCFLSRGHRLNEKGIRGADGRMGHVEDAEIILQAVISWVVSKGTPFQLFTDLRALNDARGYSKPR